MARYHDGRLGRRADCGSDGGQHACYSPARTRARSRLALGEQDSDGDRRHSGTSDGRRPGRSQARQRRDRSPGRGRGTDRDCHPQAPFPASESVRLQPPRQLEGRPGPGPENRPAAGPCWPGAGCARPLLPLLNSESAGGPGLGLELSLILTRSPAPATLRLPRRSTAPTRHGDTAAGPAVTVAARAHTPSRTVPGSPGRYPAGGWRLAADLTLR